MIISSVQIYLIMTTSNTFNSSLDELDDSKDLDSVKNGGSKNTHLKPFPMPHQLKAIAAAEEGLKHSDRGQLVMPPGTGRAFTSFLINERLNPERTLVLLPSLPLLSQVLKDWTYETSEPFDWICVCSLKSATTDLDEINSFLKGKGKKVVFSTYKSCHKISEVQKDRGIPMFDLLIAEEANCVGKNSNAFRAISDDDQIRSKKRLFFSATPIKDFDVGKTTSSEKKLDKFSTNDFSIFGDIFHLLNFSEILGTEVEVHS